MTCSSADDNPAADDPPAPAVAPDDASGEPAGRDRRPGEGEPPALLGGEREVHLGGAVISGPSLASPRHVARADHPHQPGGERDRLQQAKHGDASERGGGTPDLAGPAHALRSPIPSSTAAAIRSTACAHR